MGKDKIRTVIIDDEQHAVDLLIELLKGHPEIEVVASAHDSEEGYRMIMEHHPDLVFLDIQMPKENGLTLASRLPDLPNRPAIIFITAYDRFAISAIKEAALDYILKPVNRDELAEAIQRFQRYRFRTHVNSKLEELLKKVSHPKRIRFNTRSGFLLIDPRDILYCTAEGNYTEITFTNGKREIVTNNLGNIQEMLPADTFFRASRSYLVNIHYIIRLERKSRNCEIGLNGFSHTLVLPRTRLVELEKLIKI